MAARTARDDASDLHLLIAAFRGYERLIHRRCLAYLQNESDAEDATQETFIRSAPRLSTLEESAVGAYLTVVARRICRRELQRRHRIGLAVNELRHVETPGDPESSALDRALVDTVWSQLSRRERALFLYRFAGYSHGEIGQRLGLTANAVGLALFRARHRLRERLDALPAALPILLRSPRRGGARQRGRHAAAGSRGLPAVHTAVTVLLTLGAGTLTLAAVPALRTALSGSAANQMVSLTADRLSAGESAFTTFALSPDYLHDHTVYALGRYAHVCAGACAVMERSEDSGRTWHRGDASQLDGRSIVVVSRHVVYATGLEGLLRSDDGGDDFQLAAAIPGVAAWDGTAIVIGAQPTWSVDVRSGDIEAGPRLPGGTVAVDAMAGTGDGVLILSRRIDRAHPSQAATAVLHCPHHGACTTVLETPAGTAAHLVPAADGSSGAVVALGSRLFRWHNGGLTSAAALRPADAAAPVLAMARGGHEVLFGGDSGALLRSDNGGATVHRLATFPAVITAVAVTPDDRILVATADGTLRCSDDGGATWRTS